MNTLRSGGVFSGGLLAALAAAAWYMARHKMPPLRTCDAFAPGLAIGHAIGRLGCFAAGSAVRQGDPCAWGVVFKSPLAAGLGRHSAGCSTRAHAAHGSGLRVLQLPATFLATDPKNNADGQVFGTYLILYGIARFFIEFLRGDPGRGEVFGGIMTGTQLIAIHSRNCGGPILAAPRTKAEIAPAAR